MYIVTLIRGSSEGVIEQKGTGIGLLHLKSQHPLSKIEETSSTEGV